MMSKDNATEIKTNYDHLIAEEKNKHTVYCTKCPSKILSSTVGKHTIIEVIFYLIINLINICIDIYIYITCFFFLVQFTTHGSKD